MSSHLRGRRLVLARVVWLALTGTTLALFIAGIPRRVQDLLNLAQAVRPELAQIGLSPSSYAAYHISLEVTLVVGFALIAIVIFWRSSDDWMAVFISLMLVLFAATFPPVIDALSKNQPEWRLPVDLTEGLRLGFNLVSLYIFPTGSFIPRWTKKLAVVWVTWNLAWPFFPAANPLIWPALPYLTLYVAAYGTGLFAQIYRYRRVSSPTQQQQTKWVVFGLVAAFVGGFGLPLLRLIAPELSAAVQYGLIGKFVATTTLLLVPLTIGIAILRYRLWEIDLLINRTLVYVPLTGILAGLFAASITLSQKLFFIFTGQQSDGATVLTTLVVVAAFDPIKTRLQALVDRHFKYHAESFGEFGDKLRGLIQLIDARLITRRLLEEATAIYGANSGAVFFAKDGKLELVHTCGAWNNDAKLSVPLESGGVRAGLIVLGARRNGMDYTPQDRESLERIAELVAHTIKLIPGADSPS